jgi:hypothetical protein
MSAAFSAIMITTALLLPEVKGGSVPIDISDAGLDPSVLCPVRLVERIVKPRQAAAPQ